MFFNSWELWQKMTFVLGVGIGIVFLIGYGKLLWRNRLVKKQELVDEEKQARIRELRQSGQIIETSKDHDIPFGVRAIQSGIQVDGIWISQTSTPVPSELKLSHEQAKSELTKVVPDKQSVTTQSISELPVSHKNSDSGKSMLDHTDSSRRPGSSRKSYQPRKSSHLRYDSHGDCDETTLGYLEGHLQKRVHTHRPRGSRPFYTEADSSAADNERNSGTSSDSDATLSSLTGTDRPYEAVVEQSVSSRGIHSKSDYSSVPSTPPIYETSDPFASPLETFNFQPPNSQIIRQSSWFDDSQSQPPPLSRSPPPFVPGELHVNKSVRKVNSGFEILPAGTFGAPAEFKGKGKELDTDSLGERTSSNRLSKSRRASATSRLLVAEEYT